MALRPHNHQRKNQVMEPRKKKVMGFQKEGSIFMKTIELFNKL